MENYKKTAIFLKGFAKGKDYNELLQAIDIAEKLHADQLRKDGTPYISHPLRVANGLLLLGIDEEDVLTTAILHDVVEDCGITSNDLDYKYNFGTSVVHNVVALTKTGLETDKYYENLLQYQDAVLVKISDRCHNVSTMAGVFSPAKITEYIEETEQYVIPLIRAAVRKYPEYSEQMYYMRYHIESVISAIKLMAPQEPFEITKKEVV